MLASASRKRHGQSPVFALTFTAPKAGYQPIAVSPSFVVTFHLQTAQFKCSSMLPHCVSAFDAFYVVYGLQGLERTN